MKGNDHAPQAVARKTYVRPTLRRAGNFQELTRTNSNTQYQIDTVANTYAMS